MASIGHIAVGMAAARGYRQTGKERVSLVISMSAFSALSLAPDLDVLGFRFGVAYGDAWGHRGATHSLVFAVALGLAIALASRPFGLPFRRTAVFAVAVLASHGLLDALTDGGLGAALGWPLSHERHFAPVRPLPVAPIGRGFISAEGLRVALAELALFSPFLTYALIPRRRREPSRAT